MIATRHARLAAATGALLLLVPPAAPLAQIARGGPGMAGAGPVAVLPFVSRGTDPEAWPRLREALRLALSDHGVTLIPEEPVERELRRLRLRDMSILSHEELADLAVAVGARELLIGHVYRVSEEMMAVTFSGRLIDPVARRIDALVFTAEEGHEMDGVLGSGLPVTLAGTLAAATLDFVDALLGDLEDPIGGPKPRLLRRSPLAPTPAAFFSDGLETSRISRILVLPFRSRVPQPGAGQAAADLVSWGFVRSGSVSVVDAGDATRRLLEKGWRTGIPVSTGQILSLGLDPGVDAVLMGSVEKWVEGDPRNLKPPEIALSARLLDARTGEILWAADHERRGDETRMVYEIGNVRLAEELLARASYEMIAPLLNRMEKTARKGVQGETP
jgi:hypothetical protein